MSAIAATGARFEIAQWMICCMLLSFLPGRLYKHTRKEDINAPRLSLSLLKSSHLSDDWVNSDVRFEKQVAAMPKAPDDDEHMPQTQI